MDIIIQPTESTLNLMRRCGYAPHPADGRSFIRRAGPNPYPRFHVYVVPEGGAGIRLRLHLDQKKPSYEGSTAHSGEYDSEVVAREMERIRKALNLPQ
ncbi:hypothetical protein HY442_02145 [Candidatus Parcubacteria bacterium]|nr:hypothetical protein [Candidatus Parcubacteria bacterium]